MVRALVEAGADINALTEDGRTPLFQAAFRGHATCVAALLELHADRTIANADGKTPADATEEDAIVNLLQHPPEKKARTE